MYTKGKLREESPLEAYFAETKQANLENSGNPCGIIGSFHKTRIAYISL